MKEIVTLDHTNRCVRRWKNGGWYASQSRWTNFLKRSCDRLSAVEHHALELIWSCRQQDEARHRGTCSHIPSYIYESFTAAPSPVQGATTSLLCLCQTDAMHIPRGRGYKILCVFGRGPTPQPFSSQFRKLKGWGVGRRPSWHWGGGPCHWGRGAFQWQWESACLFCGSDDEVRMLHYECN
eukprot:COSAG02_NODE_3039_length_7496_cov_89.964715_8_plen_181_part_00